MVMVDVDGGCLIADSQPKVDGWSECWRPPDTSVCIQQINRMNFHKGDKDQPGIIIITVIYYFQSTIMQKQ